jgi:ketosteroid isomerase-like protein/predicted SnoaL-like aldol condensation-catalyzing enzyme
VNSPAPMSPGEVARAVIAGVSQLMAGQLSPPEREAQLDQLAELYAEQTDVQHPFAPLDDSPPRSRAALREHLAEASARTSGVERFAPLNTMVHNTGDPEVVVAEFAYAVSVGGHEFRVPCITVIRVRDGQIVESRDYAHQVAMARAAGQAEALAHQLLAASDHAGRERTGRMLAQRMHDAFNALDLAAAEEIFAADFYSHPLRTRGVEAVTDRWQAMRASAPALRTEVIDVIADGDRAVVRSRFSDHTGELLEILRIQDGRIAELWGARTN